MLVAVAAVGSVSKIREPIGSRAPWNRRHTPGVSRRVSLEKPHICMQRLYVGKMSFLSNEFAPLFPDDVLPPECVYESRDALIKSINAWATPPLAHDFPSYGRQSISDPLA
jgi:hypothetical protein